MARLLQRAQDQGRADDTEAVIRRRMEVYRSETEPLTAIYAEHGVLHQVDGLDPVEAVGQRLADAVAAVAD